jgi:hypothetical protein
MGLYRLCQNIGKSQSIQISDHTVDIRCGWHFPSAESILGFTHFTMNSAVASAAPPAPWSPAGTISDAVYVTAAAAPMPDDSLPISATA